MGESRFTLAAMAFASERPPRITDQHRWLRRFAAHLRDAEPYRFFPELAELAELEVRFHLALEVDDQKTSPISAAEGLGATTLCLHPSVQILAFHQNTTSLWSALQCGETPPRPFKLEQPQHVVVWRQGSTVRFRMLGEDEAAALAASHGRLSKTSPYFLSWVEAGLVVAVVK